MPPVVIRTEISLLKSLGQSDLKELFSIVRNTELGSPVQGLFADQNAYLPAEGTGVIILKHLFLTESPLDWNEGWIFQNDKANTLVKTSSITCSRSSDYTIITGSFNHQWTANIRLLADPSGISKAYTEKRSDLRYQTAYTRAEQTLAPQNWFGKNLGKQEKISNFDPYSAQYEATLQSPLTRLTTLHRFDAFTFVYLVFSLLHHSSAFVSTARYLYTKV